MTFFIKQHSTLPYIEIELEQYAKSYNIQPEHWESAVATFSMFDRKYRRYVIANSSAKIITKERDFFIDNPYNYYLRYELKLTDTAKHGEFYGEFKVDFLDNHECGKLTIPNNTYIDIVIKKSITKTTVVDNDI